MYTLVYIKADGGSVIAVECIAAVGQGALVTCTELSDLVGRFGFRA